MSQGIFIKGFPTPNVNGTYTLLSADTINTARVWDSVDRLYRMRYRQLNPEYRLTADATFEPGKAYYKYVNNQYVLDEELHDRADEVPPNVYYERFNVGQWEIVPIVSGVPSDNYVYCAVLDDDTISPDHPGVIWEDVNGVTITSAGVDIWDESSFTSVVSDPIVDETAGTITTITTTTNLVTGDVYRETNVVRTKEVYVQRTLDRYINMNLTIDKVYRFKFISDFEVLGYRVDSSGEPIPNQPINAGVFKLEKVMPYFDLIAAGIDLYANLYQIIGLKKEIYESDKNRLADTSIYKLSDPTDKSVVIYMPQIFIKEADPSVDKYSKILLTIDMGVDTGLSNLEDMKDVLTKLFEKRYGIKPANVSESLVTLTEYDNIWLTTSEAEKINKEREENKKSSTVTYSNLFDFQTTNQIYMENIRLKGMVAHLEEALVTMNNNQ